jgi:DNA-binding transcriptional regulator YiaG
VVTDVHDGQTNGPLLTDAERLLVYVRRLDAEDFARVFRRRLPDAELMDLIHALPKDRLSRLMDNARSARFSPRAPKQKQENRRDRPIARAIRIARERVGMSQEGLAEALGITQSSVSQWERGQTEPTGQRVIALMRVLPGLAYILKTQAARSADGQYKASGPG